MCKKSAKCKNTSHFTFILYCFGSGGGDDDVCSVNVTRQTERERETEWMKMT